MITKKLGFVHFVCRIFLALATCAYATTGYADGHSAVNNTTTYCFGRFLIDLPKTSVLAHQTDIFMVGAIKSELSDIDAKEFSSNMMTLEEGLRAKTRADGFQLETRTFKASNTKVFQIKERWSPSNEYKYSFEATRWVNNVIFSIKRTDSDQSIINAALQRLETDLLPNLQARKPSEIPNEPGFCIDNGFIVDSGQTPQREYSYLSFKFKEWPDVRVKVEASSLEPSLPERLDKTGSNPVIATKGTKEIKNFRKGKHDVGPLQGEETLEALPSDQGFFIHRFVWETQGKLNSATEPAFYFQLQTGGAGVQDGRPSLTDKQAIEMFDAIVNSIRLRPTTPGKTSATEPTPNDDPGAAKRLPLGTKVSSLRSCPESGVYECAADAPGVTERRAFINQGRPMPSAFVMSPKRGVSVLFGGEEQKEVELTWTLIAHKGDPT